METETISPERRRFYADMPEYHGVIAQAGADRLVLSSKGTWYMHQTETEGTEPAQGVTFYTVRKTKRLSRIRDKLPAALLEALPEAVPDDPRDQPRPWAKELEALSQAFSSASPTSEGFAGVIAQTERGRLAYIWTKSGGRYAVQVRSDDQSRSYGPWMTVCQSAKATEIKDALNGHRAARCKPVVGDALLYIEADKLAQDAAEFRGQKPPRKDELRKRFARPQHAPARSNARDRAEGGDKRAAERPQDAAKDRARGKPPKTG